MGVLSIGYSGIGYPCGVSLDVCPGMLYLVLGMERRIRYSDAVVPGLLFGCRCADVMAWP